MSATGLANLRDVSTASPLLSPGLLLRSDAPLPGDPQSGYDVAWPPLTVADLRDAGELGGQPHPFADTATVLALPVMEGRATDTRAFPASLGELYREFLHAPAADRLLAAVEAVATGHAPVLVHCAAGKDRTGVVVALALSLVGVGREEIVADYVRTEPNMPGILVRMADRHTMVDPELLAQVPEDFSHAPAEAIETVLDDWAEHDGGAEGWYLTHGGTVEVLTALRTRLLR